MKEENINCTIEALILASPEPLSVRKISEVLSDVSPARIREGIKDLNNVYMGCGCSFRIREIAGGYQVHILPDFEQPIKNLLTKQRTVRLTRAALETLAIVAYKQPVTKTDIEHIRGVASDGVIHNLMERKLILIAGRAETPGRPLLYKTSQEFLKFFGLNRLSDLPRMDEIEEMIKQAEPPKEQTVLQFGEDMQEILAGKEGEESDQILENDDDGMRVNAELPIEQFEATDEDIPPIENAEEVEEGSEEMRQAGLREMVAESDMFGTAVTELAGGENIEESDEDVAAESEETANERPEAIEERAASSGFSLPEARFECGWGVEKISAKTDPETPVDEDDDSESIESDLESEDDDEAVSADSDVKDDFAATSTDTDSPRS